MNYSEKYYSFIDLEKLKSKYFDDRSLISGNFDKIIVIGIGGSSQGSKAINSFLNEDRVIYFDNLNFHFINKTLNSINLEKTGFIFISKSGATSEILTLFDYLVGELENKINISNHFFTITEIKSSPLHDLSVHKSIGIIEHDKDIGGRFSIFSSASMIPGFMFNEKFVTSFFIGAEEGESGDSMALAVEKAKLITGPGLKNINAILVYGDELIETANWLKQLYAESLGKKGEGFMPVVSQMPQDQHSLMQLYIDGPKNIFFEILSMQYRESNFINLTLNNHRDAMFSTLKQQDLTITPLGKIQEFSEKSISTLGEFFYAKMAEVIQLAEILEIDPFTQDAVEIQKNFLK